MEDLGGICWSALAVNCGIGTCLPGGPAPDGANAFRHCSSPGRRARLLAAAIFVRGLRSARGSWWEERYCMTLLSAGLLIAFLAGLAGAAVGCGTARRNVLPRPAMIIAALAIPIWVICFASSQGRSFLASKGFFSAMPEALWFGLTFGVFTAAFFLALGYVYGDAKRREMPACAWVISAFFIPNFFGLIFFLLFGGPLFVL